MNTGLLLPTLSALAALLATGAASATTLAAPNHHPAHRTHRTHHEAAASPAGDSVARDDALDRLHAQVAAMRDADQQRQIALGLQHNRLTVEQAAQLEREQARILTRQATLERRGHETVDDALRLQHQQDVQDWAIHQATLAHAATRT